MIGSISGSFSLRFQHPNRNLGLFSALLGMPCFRSWVAGSPRRTPIGEPLPGVYKESYWTSRTEFDCEDGFNIPIAAIIDRLMEHAEILDEFTWSGGKIEIYLQLPGFVNNGDAIDAALLKKMAKMSIELAIEVFPNM